MNAVTQTLVECIATGAVFTSICAALTIPVLAWLAVRLLAPSIHGMNDDRRAQSSLAAFGASIPGLLFIFLVIYGLASSASSPCLQTTPGRVLFGTLAAMMLAAIARSVFRAVQREGEAVRTTASAVPASQRLLRIASAVGVTAYEIADEVRPVVMLYGSRKPAVYVSTKTLQSLSDEELLAAMHHERAHETRGDHRIAPMLYFLTDLMPLPVQDLVFTYRRSREFSADECAVRHVSPTDLAAALLRMVRPRTPIVAHAAAFSEPDVVRDRLDALLRKVPCHESRLHTRFILTFALGAIVAAGVAAPLIAAFVMHCSMSPPA